MGYRRTILFALATALAFGPSVGCTIQDVFRTTLGGINSDRAALNKINPANDYSYPQSDEQRTVWRLPKSDK